MLFYAIILGIALHCIALLMRPRVTRPAPPEPRQSEPVDPMADIIRRDQELFAQDPSAFWNDPRRYGEPRLEELPRCFVNDEYGGSVLAAQRYMGPPAKPRR